MNVKKVMEDILALNVVTSFWENVEKIISNAMASHIDQCVRNEKKIQQLQSDRVKLRKALVSICRQTLLDTTPVNDEIPDISKIVADVGARDVAQELDDQMMDWQPIETAPKDGTLIAIKLKHGSKALTCIYWSYAWCCWYSVIKGGSSYPLSKDCTPTHWKSIESL